MLGGAVFAIDAGRLRPWLAGTIASGTALVLLELASTFAWLTTVKGLAVLGKLALLASLPLMPDHRVGVLLALVIGASVAAHMPARFRHHQVVRAWRVPRPTLDADDLP